MTIQEGMIQVPGGKVWYQLHGSENKGTPVIVLHGGPGSSSYSLQGLSVLSDECPVILYDQLGCGRSERPKNDSLWQLDRFVEEVHALKEALGFETIDLLGHSWGTTLAAAYYLKYPQGVRKIIFSSSCLSAPRWAADQKENIKKLSPEIQGVLQKGEETGETDTAEYKEATEEFNRHFVCRLDPKPAFLEKGKEYKNPEIYQLMWGPSEFYVTGNLKEMDFTERLKEIQVPVLYLCGRHDEATPESTAYFSEQTPNSTFHVFENSAHMAYIEEPEEYEAVVREFLNRN